MAADERPHRGRRIVEFLLVVAAAFTWHPSFAAKTSLCSGVQKSVLACITRIRTYELCASDDPNAASGPLQHRAGANGVTRFSYPEDGASSPPPFHFELLPRGARLRFSNAGFTYRIDEPLEGPSSIVVTQAGHPATTTRCGTNTDALTRTATIEWFRRLGIDR